MRATRPRAVQCARKKSALRMRLRSLQALVIPCRHTSPTSAARTSRRTAVRHYGGSEEFEIYWDSDRTQHAPPNFPNHTNTRVVAEYGKKKPIRTDLCCGRAAARRDRPIAASASMETQRPRLCNPVRQRGKGRLQGVASTGVRTHAIEKVRRGKMGAGWRPARGPVRYRASSPMGSGCGPIRRRWCQRQSRNRC